MEAMINQLVLCPICRNFKKDAKTLKCQHSFCANCIVDHVGLYVGKASFPCPVCGHSSPGIGDTVAITDATHLPDDTFTQKLCNHVLSPVSRTTEDFLTECSQHPGDPATHTCVPCAVGLCTVCRSERHGDPSCRVVEAKESLSCIDQESKQQTEKLQDLLGRLTTELGDIHSALEPKRQSVLASKEATANKVKTYYAELLQEVNKYLDDQEKQILSDLDDVSEKESDYIQQRLSVATSLIASLQQRKCLITDMIDKDDNSMSPIDRLNMKIQLLSNASDMETILQDLKADSVRNLTLRFMINTELEDTLKECDLVKIEIISSCHSAPVPALFEPHSRSSLDGQHISPIRRSSGLHLSSRHRSCSNERRPQSADRRTRSADRRHLSEGQSSERQQRHTSPSLRQSKAQMRGPRPRSHSPRGLGEITGPPPPYSTNLVEIDMETANELRPRTVPSAPPLSAQRLSTRPYAQPPPISMTVPKVGVLVPQERIRRNLQRIQISKIKYRSMLDSKVADDKRNPRIVGIACIDRKLILADKWNNCLKIISKNKSKIWQVLPCKSFQPWDIAAYSSGRCVVAAPKEKQLVFVGQASYNSRYYEIVGKLNVGASYASVAYFTRHDQFICGICPPYGGPSIDILTTTGGVLKSFRSDSFGKPLFTYPRNISVTEEGTMAVCDLDTRSAILVNVDTGMYKMFSGNEQAPLQDPQCVQVLEAYQCVLVLNSKFRKLIALSFSGDFIQQLDDVPLLDNARRMVAYEDSLAFVHQDGTITFYSIQ